MPYESDELRAFLERAISDGTEGRKLDFKQELNYTTPDEKVKLCKIISAIANTDDNQLKDYGYIIFGAKPHKIVGVNNTLTDSDKLQNKINQELQTYISPVPQFHIVCYETDDGKAWGAVVISPSSNQPHVFVKELSGNPAKGDWFVRGVSSTDKATPFDYQRVLEKKTRQLIEPLQNQLQELTLRVAALEEDYKSALFQTVVGALTSKQSVDPAQEVTSNPAYALGSAFSLDLPARFQQRLRRPEDRLARDLIEEALRLRTFLESNASGLPWNVNLSDASGCRNLLDTLEKEGATLLRAVAEISASDEDGKFTVAITRALSILAKSYQTPTGNFVDQPAEYVRHYPLVLLLYTVAILGMLYERPKLLRNVFDASYRIGNSENLVQIAFVRFSLAYAHEIFDAVHPGKCESIALRIERTLQPMLGNFYTLEDATAAFLKGEFFVALAGIEARLSEPMFGTVPAPGMYLYYRQATNVLTSFLKRPPNWFNTFFKPSTEDVLAHFDRTAESVVGRSCSAEGFTQGATEAFSARS